MLYDIHQSYEHNVKSGPRFNGDIPPRTFPPRSKWIDFLGIKVASPIGVAAGPLLTSQWTTLAARLGFDIVTYKTIRSRPYPGHPLPNVVYIKPDASFDKEDKVIYSEHPPATAAELAITNSFGMPSQSLHFLEKDIAIANKSLHEGQVLVVSVVGSLEHSSDLTQDFVETALIAKHCGAQIVEANFSCPNVKSGEGSLYVNPEGIFHTVSCLVKALGDVPLIIKVGVFPNEQVLRNVLIAAARAGARAISGINSVKKNVVDMQGNFALGPNRLSSGICGAPIKNSALDFVRSAKQMIDQEKLELTLIGVGGITQPEDFNDFFEAGAEYAQTAAGMMWDPFLAMKFHSKK